MLSIGRWNLLICFTFFHILEFRPHLFKLEYSSSWEEDMCPSGPAGGRGPAVGLVLYTSSCKTLMTIDDKCLLTISYMHVLFVPENILACISIWQLSLHLHIKKPWCQLDNNFMYQNYILCLRHHNVLDFQAYCSWKCLWHGARPRNLPPGPDTPESSTGLNLPFNTLLNSNDFTEGILCSFIALKSSIVAKTCQKVTALL